MLRASDPGNLIATTSQIMIPRRVIDDVGESDGAFPVASDYDLYLRIARNTRSRSCGNTSWTGATCRRARRGPRPSGNFIGPRMMSPSCASTRGWLRRRSDPSSRIRSREGAAHCPAGVPPRLRDRSAMAWAYLWRLCRNSGGDPVVAIYLMAVLMPRRIRRLIAPVGRRRLLRPEEPAPLLRSLPDRSPIIRVRLFIFSSASPRISCDNGSTKRSLVEMGCSGRYSSKVRTRRWLSNPVRRCEPQTRSSGPGLRRPLE